VGSMRRQRRVGEEGGGRVKTHFCWPGVVNACPQSRQINWFSDGVNAVAGDSAAMDGVVMADELDGVVWVAGDAKLESVLAESGVDLLDCGLGAVLEFCKGDALGTKVRWLGRLLCLERSIGMRLWLLDGSAVVLLVSKRRRSRPATLLLGAKVGAGAGMKARIGSSACA
jgi:hypothetical protein